MKLIVLSVTILVLWTNCEANPTKRNFVPQPDCSTQVQAGCTPPAGALHCGGPNGLTTFIETLLSTQCGLLRLPQSYDNCPAGVSGNCYLHCATSTDPLCVGDGDELAVVDLGAMLDDGGVFSQSTECSRTRGCGYMWMEFSYTGCSNEHCICKRECCCEPFGPGSGQGTGTPPSTGPGGPHDPCCRRIQRSMTTAMWYAACPTSGPPPPHLGLDLPGGPGGDSRP